MSVQVAKGPVCFGDLQFHCSFNLLITRAGFISKSFPFHAILIFLSFLRVCWRWSAVGNLIIFKRVISGIKTKSMKTYPSFLCPFLPCIDPCSALPVPWADRPRGYSTGSSCGRAVRSGNLLCSQPYCRMVSGPSPEYSSQEPQDSFLLKYFGGVL